MTPPFRLQSVLQLRQHELQIERQNVAADRHTHDTRVAERDKLAKSRLEVLSELRRLNECSILDIEKLNEHRRYAEELGRLLNAAEARVQETLRKLETSLERLVAANRSAESLERLADRHIAACQVSQRKVEDRVFDDFHNSIRRAA